MARTRADRADGGGGAARPRIGVGLIGFGWLGQAHSRSLLRIRTLFPEREFEPELAVVSDTHPGRVDEAVGSFGYARGSADWRRVVDDPAVDLVVIAAPNALHLELIEAAAEAGKAVFCEKPVGGTPRETARAERAARRAGVITGVGYNYRWAPLVRYAAQLVQEGRLGRVTNYRGRFFSMYGSDPLGLLSWRFRLDEGGHGVTTDLLSHAVDLAHVLVGPITRVVGTVETFIRERPLPAPSGGTHYGRGRPGDPAGEVTNEDYAGMLCEFENGARGSFESARTLLGPESQMAFDLYGTGGALAWNLERLNELQVYLATDEPHSGYTTVYGGDRFPYHGRFVPGNANGIGFEDLIAIEDYELCRSVAEGRPHSPGFEDALAAVSVQAALLRSCESGRWEDVVSLRED
ncbi:MAG TPA: Gfo/Idh/MocA family oxidoreductase [Thermoleophilaceae bacterium]|nr:Gfo/Idh/MocA family oxidoreductase [Thermoleophilaceae bacterium]